MASITVSLDSELQAYVQERMKAEGFASMEEYVCDALRRERDRRAEYERKRAELRRELDIGIKQLERGEYTSYDETTIKDLAEEICQGGRRRMEERKGAVALESH